MTKSFHSFVFDSNRRSNGGGLIWFGQFSNTKHLSHFPSQSKVSNRPKNQAKSNQICNDATNNFELIKEFHLGIQLFSEKPHCKTIKTKAVVTKGAAGYWFINCMYSTHSISNVIHIENQLYSVRINCLLSHYYLNPY